MYPVTPEQAAGAVKPTALELGGAYREWPETLCRVRTLGVSTWSFYVAGRGGALGDVGAATVAAALGFIAPEAVADGWDGALRTIGTRAVATVSYTECCRWGVRHLDGVPWVEKLADLLHRAVHAADPTGMPLFAAWRAMPLPEETPAARVAAHLLLLRELFTGAHLVAVRAGGMTPLAAVLAGPEGEAGAVACGWSRPFPPVGPLVRRRLWAEAVTDRIVAPAFADFDERERVELVALLAATREHLRTVPATD